MKIKLKIAHIHVWDKNNKGDVAIVLAVQELLKKYLGAIEIVDFPVEFLKCAREHDIKRLNSCALAVIGGGGIYYHYFLPYCGAIIKKIKIPLVIFGVGYIREIGARALTRQERESVAFLNNQAALISVRDNYSKQFLAANGVRKSNISVIGDPAIFLTERKCEVQKQNSKVKIGLNLNYAGWLGFGQHKSEILSAYAQAADYFQKNHDAQLYYFLHHPGEKVILKELPIKNLIIIDVAIREQKYIYSQLDIMIGMMLHSCVLAFGAGTPEINVAYDIRNKNFARFIGLPELFVALDELKEGILLERAKKVFQARERYRQQFSLKKNKIWQKHEQFLQKIQKLISSL
ncbi:MAG: polysaccharide pyruvyl transferase family protein [Patescibacteria group bacterium]|jgi:polysaccharide pyruvyl transferase WcaK-like protein